MKKVREIFHFISAWGSGICLVLMVLLILAQIVARMIGVVIPSSEDFAGWIFSAIIFFGLAFTFNEGGHIRVTILLNRLSEKVRKPIEFFNLVMGLLISGFLAFYTFITAYESYVYEEVTDTYLVVPLWAIQVPMALGSICLFVAILDNFVTMVMGKTPNYLTTEEELDIEG